MARAATARRSEHSQNSSSGKALVLGKISRMARHSTRLRTALIPMKETARDTVAMRDRGE